MKNNTIIITGAYGFIGSCLVAFLNKQGFDNLILVDEFDNEEKELNLLHKKYLARVERDNLFDWLLKEKPIVDYVFHLGARTDTAEFDYSIHQKLNVEYTQNIWNYCTINNIPLVYASSAATYGDGELGYYDTHEIVEQLQPLNPYGISKNEIDKWILHQTDHPPFWAGLKFFNVYGPNEYHKKRMASVIFHAYNQIQQSGKVRLFKSHKNDFNDGEQLRDFIYVKDVVNVCYWLMQKTIYNSAVANIKNEPLHTDENFSSSVISGLYNLGTGVAQSFNELVNATFAALNLQPCIEYIDMPQDIKDKYQYFTEAKMEKLKAVGYHQPFYTLQNGVADYVKNYLTQKLFY